MCVLVSLGVCLGLIGSIFQMRRLNHQEISALSWDSWGLFKLSGLEFTWSCVR